LKCRKRGDKHQLLKTYTQKYRKNKKREPDKKKYKKRDTKTKLNLFSWNIY